MLYFLYFRGGYAAIWNQKCWAFITIPVSMPPTRLESTEPLLVPISRRVSWRWRSFRFKNFLETQFTNHKQQNTHTDTHTHTDLPLKTNTHTHIFLMGSIMLLQTSPIDQPSESYSDQNSTKIGNEKPSTFTWWNPPSLTASMRHSRNQGWEALELPLVEPGWVSFFEFWHYLFGCVFVWF